MLVVVRADATALTGVGHVMRCLALAEEFARSGDRIHWVGDLASQPWVAHKVRELVTTVTEPEGTESDQADQVLEFNPDLTIVDSYELGEAFCLPVQSSLTTLVAIIDSVSHLTPADMYVAPNIDPISQEVVGDTRILQGAQYVMIREELRYMKGKLDSSKEQASRQSGVRRVAVLMGGTDVAGLAPRIVEALLSLEIPLSINVAPRPTQALGKADLPGPSKSSTVTWWDAGEDIYPRIAEAELVISAAGVSSWELLYLGLPTALVQVADNQNSNYQWMTSRGHAWGLGRSDELQNSQVLQAALRVLLGLGLRTRRSQGKIIDGLGAERLAKAIRQLTTTKSGSSGS